MEDLVVVIEDCVDVLAEKESTGDEVMDDVSDVVVGAVSFESLHADKGSPIVAMSTQST